MAARLRVTLVKSPIGHNPTTRATMRALGLRRIGQTIEIDDTPQLRGMLRAIRFLLRTEEIEAQPEAAAPAARTRRRKEEGSS